MIYTDLLLYTVYILYYHYDCYIFYYIIIIMMCDPINILSLSLSLISMVFLRSIDITIILSWFSVKCELISEMSRLNKA